MPIDTNLDKYKQTNDSEGPIKFQFNLIVIDVEESDYAFYTCTATNEKGTSEHDIQLTGTSEFIIFTQFQISNILKKRRQLPTNC